MINYNNWICSNFWTMVFQTPYKLNFELNQLYNILYWNTWHIVWLLTLTLTLVFWLIFYPHFKQIDCSLCGEAVEREAWTVHKGERCQQRMVTCEYCEFPLPAVDLLNHQVIIVDCLGKWDVSQISV